MLVVRGTVEGRQAIVKIGLQRLVPQAIEFTPEQPFPQIPLNEYRALIDTGAQRTCLTRKTIAQEGLVRHGKRPVQNVHSQNIHYLFWIHLGFWCEASLPAGAQETDRTYYALPQPVEVIDIASNYWFDAIIGMDVLSQFDLRLDRTGEFVLRLG